MLDTLGKLLPDLSEQFTVLGKPFARKVVPLEMVVKKETVDAEAEHADPSSQDDVVAVKQESQASAASSSVPTDASVPAEVVETRSAATGAEATRRKTQVKQEPADPPQDVEMPGEVVETPCATPDAAAPQPCPPKPEPGCTMMLQRQYGEAVLDGRKIWEGRPKGNPGTTNIMPGVYIKLRLGSQSAKFPYLLAQVVEIREFVNAKAMLSTLGIAALLPDGPESLDEAVAVYHNLGEKYKGPMVAYRLVDPWWIDSEGAASGRPDKEPCHEEAPSKSTGTKRSGKQKPAAEQEPAASASDAKRARTDPPAVSDLGSQQPEAPSTKEAMLDYVRGFGFLWEKVARASTQPTHAIQRKENGFAQLSEGIQCDTDCSRCDEKVARGDNDYCRHCPRDGGSEK